MSQPKYFSDQAIVIKRHNYGEADRLVTFFTSKSGKVTAVAKGVRKLTSRKASHIEPFAHTKLYLVNTKGLPLITQAETINNFDQIRNNLNSTRLAFHIIEVIDKILPEEQAQPIIFKDALGILNYLDHTNSTTQAKQLLAISAFHLQLLSQLGFGLPEKHDSSSIDHFIEQIIDRKLTARKHLT